MQHNSTNLQSFVNLVKMSFGIAAICYPYTVQYVGFTGAICYLTFIMFISQLQGIMLIKARNRFKHLNIIDLADMGGVFFGNGMKLFIEGVLLVTYSSFLLAYLIYLGENAAELNCHWKADQTVC